MGKRERKGEGAEREIETESRRGLLFIQGK